MKDIDKRACKVCGVTKNRIFDGKYNHKDKRYVDESGRYWNGSTCPSCNNNRIKSIMRDKRRA